MADTVVSDGQVSTGAVLQQGDTMEVVSTTQSVATGGKALNTTIEAGGHQTLSYGTADHPLVAAGGFLEAGPGSVVINASVIGPENQSEYSTFSNGGREFLEGATSYGGVVDGGYQTLFSEGGVPAAAFDTVLVNGGVQYVEYGSTVTDTVIGGGGRQVLGATPSGYTVTNDHLLPGGTITLTALSYVPGESSASWDAATGLLTVTSGSASQQISLAGDYADARFAVSGSGNPFGVDVQLLCFGRGTAIATPAGERPVEALRPGDTVLARGVARPVRWVGAVVTLVHERNRPVIVRAGAIADGVPSRDLRVTRGHAFLFNEVLIPIGALVNGLSIIWDTARTVELFHVELDRHDVLLANGAPAESYRDAGNRPGFTVQQGARAAAGTMPTCRPVAIKGPIVERTHRRLARRAEQADMVNRPPCAAASW